MQNPVANVSSLATGKYDTDPCSSATQVSKSDDIQDTAAQVSALKSAGCKRVFEDKASGGRWDRPELHRLLDQLRAGDTLVVWKLDRLSRSLKDLLHILEKVEAVGARFRSLTEAIDTSGPAGRMLMQMLGSFAEFERAMVRERTRAGLKAAAARGRKGGRQPKLTPEQKAEILDGSAQVGRVRLISRGSFGCTGPPSAAWPPRRASLRARPNAIAVRPALIHVRVLFTPAVVGRQ